MEEMITVATKLQLGVHLDIRGAATAAGPGPLIKRVTLAGAAQPRGADIKSPGDLKELPGGYAMTMVPKSHWEQWLAQNKDSPLITSGLIFAQSKSNSAQAQAKEQGELRSGFEPIMPDDPKHRVKTVTRAEIEAG